MVMMEPLPAGEVVQTFALLEPVDRRRVRFDRRRCALLPSPLSQEAHQERHEADRHLLPLGPHAHPHMRDDERAEIERGM